MKFVKKPVEVEATQWFKNGDHPEDYSVTHEMIEDDPILGDSYRFPEFRKRNNWEGDVVRYYRIPHLGEEICPHCKHSNNSHGWIDTLEGGHRVCVGDWIITSVKGEYYPCKPDVFELTYKKAAPEIADPIADLRTLAESGDSDAQVKMGKAYHKDEDNVEGVKKDCSEAIRWWKKAADQGNAKAQYSLGNSYYDGKGVAKDLEESANWYRRAAEQGHANAQFYIGYAYERGEGVAKDQVEAVKWYRKAAEQGDAYAQYIIGDAYLEGEGVAKDQVEADKWYARAGGLESAPMPVQKVTIPMPVQEITINWWSLDFDYLGERAKAGDVDAQNRLGDAYYFGEGRDVDQTEAVKWYRRAAEQGNSNAQYSLGFAYRLGYGVGQDLVESDRWYALSKA